MAAAVAPLPQPLPMAESSSAEARKRRREILHSQRNIAPDVALSALTSGAKETFLCSIAVSDVESSSEEVPAKRQKIAESSTSKKGKPAKKPQMKYDPEEPMTKEEAAVWRREQRRKRNRESAAASRQRQRDRITELEAEVEDWKTKYDSIMARIAQVETVVAGKSQPEAPVQSLQLTIEPPSKFVSPNSSPSHSPVSSPVASPIASSPVVGTVKVTPGQESTKPVKQVRILQEQHSNKMMSRLAVKIADAVPAIPLLQSDVPVLPPEACVSSSTPGIKLDPIDSALFPAKEEKLPDLLTDEEAEDEFGEFLLDAVQWL